jgi:hypothetical protein
MQRFLLRDNAVAFFAAFLAAKHKLAELPVPVQLNWSMQKIGGFFRKRV